MLDVCLRSGGGVLLGGGLGTYFVSANGSKPVVSKGSVGGSMVGITGGETYVATLTQ